MKKIVKRAYTTHLLILSGFGLLLLSACEKPEERDKLVGSSYEVQTYIGSKPFQRCTLRFEAEGKAYWDKNGNNSEWNYDVSETEILLAKHTGLGGQMYLQMREGDTLYGNPCGGLMKKVNK